jgi:hypothetical protein
MMPSSRGSRVEEGEEAVQAPEEVRSQRGPMEFHADITTQPNFSAEDVHTRAVSNDHDPLTLNCTPPPSRDMFLCLDARRGRR